MSPTLLAAEVKPDAPSGQNWSQISSRLVKIVAGGGVEHLFFKTMNTDLRIVNMYLIF